MARHSRWTTAYSGFCMRISALTGRTGKLPAARSQLSIPAGLGLTGLVHCKGLAMFKLTRGLFIFLLGLALAAPPLPALPVSGWLKVDIPATGSYYWRYVPQSLTASQPAPLVLFFHGAGSLPDDYLNFVRDAAESAGCVLALPKASGVGWGTSAAEQT